MVYELRTYKIPEGRMPDALNRFENITFGLFEKAWHRSRWILDTLRCQRTGVYLQI